MKLQYIVIVLLLALIFIVSKQSKAQKSDPEQKEQLIYRHYPSHMMSYYYPFPVMPTFRRHHRFHAQRHRRLH